MPDVTPSAFTGVFHRPFDEQVAFFRAKLGRLVPTSFWTDLQKAEHDRAFMVAGAAKMDLLQDLAAAVDKAIAEGIGIDQFRKDFFAIAQRHGWTNYTGSGSAGGRAWRTRVIYQTNAATSYAAGRLAQLRAAKFPLWVYKHTDGELYPRPQHESWDGLVLPADHPFWKTHYPPNGWGCQCYVLGAFTPALAKMLGGDPEKKLPKGWEKVVAKTGEPAGIDEGWGYMPGGTVSDAVAQAVQEVAPKLGDWDASLAKAYMDTVPADTRDALATAYRNLPSTADDARRYAQRIAANRLPESLPSARTLGIVTDQQAVAMGRAADGGDVRGFDFSLTPDSVRAALAAGAEPADFAALPRLLNSAQITIRSDGTMRLGGIIDGVSYITEWRVSAAQRTLTLQSLQAQQQP